jgi:Arc/MetJ family transcription regulator
LAGLALAATDCLFYHGSLVGKGGMMTKIEIELDDTTAQAAQAAGLLTPQALARLFDSALRRQRAVDSLLTVADDLAAAGVEPVSMEEINAEVKAARRQRAVGY